VVDWPVVGGYNEFLYAVGDPGVDDPNAPAFSSSYVVGIFPIVEPLWEARNGFNAINGGGGGPALVTGGGSENGANASGPAGGNAGGQTYGGGVGGSGTGVNGTAPGGGGGANADGAPGKVCFFWS
jgi:hypothetical protein